MLLRAGWTEKATKKFIMAVATAAHDDEAESRLQDVVSTDRRLGEQKQVTGTPTLAELIGDDIVEKVCEWLELKRENDESSPHHTDLGNARRLVAGHGKNLAFATNRENGSCGTAKFGPPTTPVSSTALRRRRSGRFISKPVELPTIGDRAI